MSNNQYHHVALQPETYEQLIKFQKDYFKTDKVPNGEAVEVLIREYNGDN